MRKVGELLAASWVNCEPITGGIGGVVSGWTLVMSPKIEVLPGSCVRTVCRSFNVDLMSSKRDLTIC